MPGPPDKVWGTEQAEDVASLLQQMVHFNSINPALPGATDGGRDLIDYLESFAETWGLPCERLPLAGQPDQLLLRVKADESDDWLLLDSHLDTVAVEGMTIDPFGAERRDGRIHGRGAADTKGTAAAMLWALRQYAAQPGGNNVALLLSFDEEVSMSGVTDFLDHRQSHLPGKFVGAIVGEPTGLRPVIAHNGCMRSRITTQGVACHSSVPHEGRSAISDMLHVIRRIEKVYAPSLTAEHPLTGVALCTVNTIHGGSAANIIPDRCTIEVDRRSVPGETPFDVARELESLLITHQREKPELRYQHRIDVNHPPLTPDRNGSLADWAQGVLAHLSLPTLSLGAPFATHAGPFDAAGLPAIVLGPGSPHTAHTRDEWVDIAQIERGVELYEALMRTPMPRDSQ
jgi:acetylornithine deacetylase